MIFFLDSLLSHCNFRFIIYILLQIVQFRKSEISFSLLFAIFKIRFYIFQFFVKHVANVNIDYLAQFSENISSLCALFCFDRLHYFIVQTCICYFCTFFLTVWNIQSVILLVIIIIFIHKRQNCYNYYSVRLLYHVVCRNLWIENNCVLYKIISQFYQRKEKLFYYRCSWDRYCCYSGSLWWKDTKWEVKIAFFDNFWEPFCRLTLKFPSDVRTRLWVSFNQRDHCSRSKWQSFIFHNFSAASSLITEGKSRRSWESSPWFTVIPRDICAPTDNPHPKIRL